MESTRPPTMADIAQHLGVSRQLVSLVLRGAPGPSDASRERILTAAAELGFSPHRAARSLRSARSTALGVVFAPAHSTEPEIVAAMYGAAAERGYDVILSAHTPERTTEQAVQELLGHRCAALVLIGPGLSHERLTAIAERSPVPVVDVGHGQAGGGYDVVRSAGDDGVAAMVEHLAALGHEHIAYVDPVDMPMAPLRRAGYDRTVDRLGLRRDRLVGAGEYTATTYFEEVGCAAARELLGRGELPTAVVAANDHTALGLLQVLSRAGVRVPEDVSVAGFDDAPVARISGVDLTTVRQDPALMGEAAVHAALRRVVRPQVAPEETVVPTRLVLRRSVSAPG